MIARDDRTSSCVAAEGLVLDALAGRHSLTSAELVDETGLVGPAVRLALRVLRDRGVVARVLAGRWQLAADREPRVRGGWSP